MSNGPDFTPKCYLDPVLMKEFMGEQASERKTPETEAAKAIGAIPFEQQEQILMSEIVPAAFARQLERQRDEALEELGRVKAPVEGEIAEVVCELRADKVIDPSRGSTLRASKLDLEAAALLESLAARNAELFEQVAALTEERDWYSTANERAERAEADLSRMTEMAGANHAAWKQAEAELAKVRADYPRE